MNDFEALIADAWIVVLGLSHSWNLLSAMLFEDRLHVSTNSTGSESGDIGDEVRQQPSAVSHQRPAFKFCYSHQPPSAIKLQRHQPSALSTCTYLPFKFKLIASTSVSQ